MNDYDIERLLDQITAVGVAQIAATILAPGGIPQPYHQPTIESAVEVAIQIVAEARRQLK